jgi:hypothetical protein
VQLRRVVVLQGYLLVQAWEFGMLVRGPLCQILKTKSGGMGSGSFRFSFMQMATTSQQLS